MISFSQIPQNLRVPLFYAEFDPSKANTGQQAIQRALIIGQIVTGGTAVAGVPILQTGKDAIGAAGAGSMLALMVDKYRLNDPFGEVWLLPLADDGAAVAALGSVNFTHVASAAGTFSLNIGDALVQIAVTPTMTLANLATALQAAAAAIPNLPVTSAVDGAVTSKVNFTARNAGASENDIPLVVNAGGIPAGQQLPTALTTTVVAMASGATNPSLTAGLAALGDMPFDMIIMPYFDTTSLDSLKTFMDNVSGRWSPYQQLYGHAITAMRGTVGALTTLGLARNDPHMTIIGENGSLTPHWLWSPACAASAFAALKADPARPMQTLQVDGVSAPPPASQFLLTERNTLLFSGISTFMSNADGSVALENLITTYQKNAFAQPDDSYLEIETMFQLMFLVRDLKGFVTSQYPRMKLADSLSRVGPGSFTVTPAQVKADLVGHYATLVANNQAQDVAAFEAGLIVEQNPTNHDRLDVLYDPKIMNQLRIFAALIQFTQ